MVGIISPGHARAKQATRAETSDEGWRGDAGSRQKVTGWTAQQLKLGKPASESAQWESAKMGGSTFAARLGYICSWLWNWL